MRLIADSGSTKTEWVLIDQGTVKGRFKTQGINPCHQSEEAILTILRDELLLPCNFVEVQQVFFYGSGVRPELELKMRNLLQAVFPTANIEAQSDLLGAAHSVCGHEAGIACILGTGANSCLYDGYRIVQNTPPLGYILGDEGSGAVLGARFLNALYKGFLDDCIVADFEKETGLQIVDVIRCVYREPMANRFLASFSTFIRSKLNHPEISSLVIENFRDFFRRNIIQYDRRDLPVGFVGSIAFYYEEQLREAAALEQYVVGKILKSPIDGLLF
jgi:N-acetylglucosamine kinase-like BadF-type ATPase